MIGEEVFVMLKPDAFERKLVGKIISKIESTTSLKLEKCMLVVPSLRKIEEWYEQKDKFSKREYPPKDLIVRYLSRGPLMPMIWAGKNSLTRIRKVVGDHTDPQKNKDGTIRRDFGIDTIQDALIEKRAVENLVHSSITLASAKREIHFWFKK